MNASFPDHDFSSLTADQFVREPSPPLVVSRVNRHLAELGESYHTPFLEELWSAIEDVIDPRNCEVYTYMPDMDEDPFSDGALWSFNYFFFNRSLKRILYLTCIARSRTALGDESGGAWSYEVGGDGGMEDDDPDDRPAGDDAEDMDAEFVAELDL